MEVRVLGSYGSRLPGHQMSCLMVDRNLVLDAGGLTGVLSVEEQSAIDHVLLTHAHLDHVYDLAFMIDNVLTLRSEPLQVWAPEPVLDALRAHLFNDQIWPDMSRVRYEGHQVLEFSPLVENRATRIGALEVCWARTEHTVYSAGYLVADAEAAILYSGDTTSTEDLWALGAKDDRLKAVFVEASFPNRLEGLAKESGHLTPGLLVDELDKLDKSELPVKIFHMKPQYLDEISADLAPLRDRGQMLQGNECFTF